MTFNHREESEYKTWSAVSEAESHLSARGDDCVSGRVLIRSFLPFAAATVRTGPCGASVAEGTRPRRWIRRQRSPPGWAWPASPGSPPAGPGRGHGCCLAGATSLARWATEGEPAECWAGASSACSWPRPAGWSLWKGAWSACRGWGSERCWWGEWIWPPRSWWCLDTAKQRACQRKSLVCWQEALLNRHQSKINKTFKYFKEYFTENVFDKFCR